MEGFEFGFFSFFEGTLFIEDSFGEVDESVEFFVGEGKFGEGDGGLGGGVGFLGEVAVVAGDDGEGVGAGFTEDAVGEVAEEDVLEVEGELAGLGVDGKELGVDGGGDVVGDFLGWVGVGGGDFSERVFCLVVAVEVLEVGVFFFKDGGLVGAAEVLSGDGVFFGVELAEEGDEFGLLFLGDVVGVLFCGAFFEDLVEGGGGAIVEVGGALPEADEGGGVEAGEGFAEAGAAVFLDGAEVVEQGAGAIGEGGAGVAGVAVEADEVLASFDGVGGEGAVGIFVGALGVVGEGGEVFCEVIELGAEAGFVGEEGAELFFHGFGEEAGAFVELADLVVEVLDFIEVSGPVELAVFHAAASSEVDGVAETFAEVGEVPGAAIVRAIEVAAGAAHVAFAGEVAAGGVVEDLFSAQDAGGEEFFGDGGPLGLVLEAAIGLGVEDGDAAGELVVEVEVGGVWVGGDGGGAFSVGVVGGGAVGGVGVDGVDGGAAEGGDVEDVAEGVIGGGGGEVVIV